MNTNNNTPDCLQESFRLMLMTLEYGGNVNMKKLEELEMQLKESNNQLTSCIDRATMIA